MPAFLLACSVVLHCLQMGGVLGVVIGFAQIHILGA